MQPIKFTEVTEELILRPYLLIFVIVLYFLLSLKVSVGTVLFKWHQHLGVTDFWKIWSVILIPNENWCVLENLSHGTKVNAKLQDFFSEPPYFCCKSINFTGFIPLYLVSLRVYLAMMWMQSWLDLCAHCLFHVYLAMLRVLSHLLSSDCLLEDKKYWKQFLLDTQQK